MSEVSIIGIDVAKQVFQLHGASADGSVVFRKKITRARLLDFLSQQPRCVVVMEACATANGWGRKIASLSHEVKLIAPIYVKPFVKRQKNDATDGHCCRTILLRDSLCESMPLDALHEQATSRPLSHDELVQLQRVSQEAGVSAHLGRQGHDLARAA